jgi:hypothetical protein
MMHYFPPCSHPHILVGLSSGGKKTCMKETTPARQTVLIHTGDMVGRCTFFSRRSITISLVAGCNWLHKTNEKKS